MKKYGLVIGIISLCVAGCFFFLVGILVPGLWWLSGIPFAAFGMFFVLTSDKLNDGKAKRAEQKQELENDLKLMKQNLYEQLDREKEARAEILRQIHK